MVTLSDSPNGEELDLFWTGPKPKGSDYRGWCTFQVAKNCARELKAARKRAERDARYRDAEEAQAEFERKKGEILATFAKQKANIDADCDWNEATPERQAELRAERAAALDARLEAEAPTRFLEQARAFGIILSLDEDLVGVARQATGRFSGSVVRVETSGQIRGRVTATRVALLGMFALAAQKKVDERQLFLTIEGDGFQCVVQVDPSKSAAAREFAARYNTMAAGGTDGDGGLVARDPVQDAVPVAAPTANLVDQLSQLVALRDAGALSDEEFAAAKAQLLGTAPTTTPRDEVGNGPQDR